jgi:hypothetical protein
LKVPERAFSAVAVASSTETLGVEGAMLPEINVRTEIYAVLLLRNVLGLTKEEPRETTLLDLMATLATALAKGMPS